MDPDRITRHQIQEGLERILPRVTKPGRYTGGELNSVVKEWDSVQVHRALAFPDIYHLGMSNLGLMVLYGLLNHRPDMRAEHKFGRWIDMEDALRSAGLPWYTLESKRPVKTAGAAGRPPGGRRCRGRDAVRGRHHVCPPGDERRHGLAVRRSPTSVPLGDLSFLEQRSAANGVLSLMGGLGVDQRVDSGERAS